MPTRHGTALLLIDVINTFDFPGAGPLVRAARRASRSIADLARSARAEGVAVIYVNDNFGRWTSDFQATIRECTRPGRPGRDVCERLRPAHRDYFVLKPQHSGFYATPLDLLLSHLRARTLVLTGFATNLCILFTADDAHMRGYHIVVPRDGCAANTPRLSAAGLEHIRVALAGETPRAGDVDFRRYRGRRLKPRSQTF